MDREPPPRVVSNLLVRASAGNLPKTIPTLLNALKPHSFVTVFCPPSAVLAHLGLKHKEKPPSISFIAKEQGKVDAKKVFSQAQFKARRYNASLEVITHGAPTAHKLEQSLRSMPLLNQVSLEKLFTQACITTKDSDPAVVLERLKTLQFVHTDDNGRVTYSIDSIDSPTLREFCGLQTLVTTQLHATLPSSSPKPLSASKSTASPVLPGASSPVIAALQCLWKLGNDLPKTEEKLVNVLKPTCKVVSVCLPGNVLVELDKTAAKKQLYVYEKRVLKFSPVGMFDANRDNAEKKLHPPTIQGQRRKGKGLKGKWGRHKTASSFAIHSPKESTKRSHQEPSSLERALIHLKNGLVHHTRKVNGSILYGTDDDVIQTVAKVERWLAQKQSLFQKFEAASSDSDRYEPMETEEATSSTDSAAGSTAVSTKQKLVHEFFDLCITRSELDPKETLDRLISSGIIAVNESGRVSYNLNSRKAQLLANKDAAVYVAAERTCIRFLIRRNKGDISLSSLAGTKRKHRNIRKRSKKIHF